MSKNNRTFETHDFYCIKCGNKGIPISRGRNHWHGKEHRKKLYCLYCKQETNHIECINQEEAEKFKVDFLKGKYQEEANEYGN